MNEISALPAGIRDWLAGREELSGMVFLTEFPPVRKAVPLKKVTVAVGIKKIEIADTFASDDENGVLNSNEYCRNAVITLRFSIHAPYSQGGAACHSAFADIIDCLTFDSGLDVTASGCEGITEDRQTDALVLGAYASVRANLCPAQSGDIDFPSFIDKTLLCGSHIRDESIHLSPRQREFLEHPFISGTYYGTGNASRAVSLGFAPLWVTVFAGDMPANAPAGSGSKAYSACGIQEAATLGLSLGQSGFTVKNGSAYAVSGTEPALNETGVIYSYIALR